MDERLQDAINAAVAPSHGYATVGSSETHEQRRMADWDALLIGLSQSGWKFITPEGDEWTPPTEPRHRPGYARMIPLSEIA